MGWRCCASALRCSRRGACCSSERSSVIAGRSRSLSPAASWRSIPRRCTRSAAGCWSSVVDLFCLVGTALLFNGDAISPSRRRVILGGIAFGVALLVKAPGIVPIVVLAVLCASDARRRLLPFLGGAVAGFGIPTLPFFVLAPGSFMRDIFTAALNSSPGTHRVSIPTRLGDITGTAALNGGASIAIVATIVIVGIVAAAFLVRPQRPPSTLEWYAIAAAVLAVTAQILPDLLLQQLRSVCRAVSRTAPGSLARAPLRGAAQTSRYPGCRGGRRAALHPANDRNS